MEQTVGYLNNSSGVHMRNQSSNRAMCMHIVTWDGCWINLHFYCEPAFTNCFVNCICVDY